MNKKAAMLLLSIVLGISLFSVTAFADPVEENGQVTGVIEQESTAEGANEGETAPVDAVEQGDIEETGQEAPVQEEEEAVSSGTALTPDGNLTLVDDYGSANGEGKQFITLSTRSGNIFYLIIDRDDEGNETVHFLNQVDEEDLFALMDEDAAVQMQEEIAAAEAEREAEAAATLAEQETAGRAETPAAEPETEQAGANPVLLALPLILVFGGVGVYLFLKKKRGKKVTAGADPDSDYDDDDPDIYDLPEEVDEDPVSDDDPEYLQDEEE